jgi:hypothetical protein
MSTQFVTSCRPPAISLLTLSILPNGATNIKWNSVFGAVSYEYFVSTNATPPTSGIGLTDTAVVINNLNAATDYYVYVRSNCGNALSEWIFKKFTTTCFVPSLNVSLRPNRAAVDWKSVRNAVKYEYSLSNNPTKPLSGVYTIDTFYTMDRLANGSAYYFHVRGICSGGTVSDWTTVNFNMQGLKAYPNPVKGTLTVNLYGIANGNGNINIFDAMGKLMKKLQLTGNSMTVNTSDWRAGIYLLRYNDGQNEYTVRVIKL